MKNGKRNLVLVLLVWIGIMYVLSSQDGTATSRTSILLVNKIMEVTGVTPTATTFTKIHILLRKTAHVVLYLIFGILVMSIWYAFLPERIYVKREFLVVLIVCTVSIADEWHKQFIPGRHNDFKDVMLNIAAGLAGVLLTYYIKQKRSRFIKE